MVSCCGYDNPKKYAAHAWQHSILVWLLGRSVFSSPSTKNLYGQALFLATGCAENLIFAIIYKTSSICSSDFRKTSIRFATPTRPPPSVASASASLSPSPQSWRRFAKNILILSKANQEKSKLLIWQKVNKILPTTVQFDIKSVDKTKDEIFDFIWRDNVKTKLYKEKKSWHKDNSTWNWDKKNWNQNKTNYDKVKTIWDTDNLNLGMDKT